MANEIWTQQQIDAGAKQLEQTERQRRVKIARQPKFDAEPLRRGIEDRIQKTVEDYRRLCGKLNTSSFRDELAQAAWDHYGRRYPRAGIEKDMKDWGPAEYYRVMKDVTLSYAYERKDAGATTIYYNIPEAFRKMWTLEELLPTKIPL